MVINALVNVVVLQRSENFCLRAHLRRILTCFQGRMKPLIKGVGVMKTTLKTLIVAVVSSAGGTAYAADLAPRPAPVAAPVPYYNWTGIYVGVNGGYGWGRQDPFNIISNRFDQFSTNISGGVVGGTIGAQVQVSHVVLGMEADLDWAGIKGSTVANATAGGLIIAGPFNAQTKIDWESTARLRVGYANDNWLLYATGGLALLGAKTNLTTPGGAAVCAGVFTSCNGADRQFGGVLGAGVEYGFTPNLSGKLEYLYLTAASLEVSRHSEVRAGLNYRFGM
jgi:outer membrane immunogenic protein